jgi:hypothetical protein
MRMTSSCCAAADSVMGCFSKRPGDGDASSGAVSYIGYCAPCSGNTPKPHRGHKHTNPSWQLRWFLPTSYAFRVTLSDMQRQRHYWSRLRSSERNQTSQCFRLSSENIGSSYGFGPICVVSTTSCHTSLLCQSTRDSKLQNR